VLGQLASNTQISPANQLALPRIKTTRRLCSRLTTGASRAPLKLAKLCRIEIRTIKISRRKNALKKTDRSELPTKATKSSATLARKNHGKIINAASGLTIQS
jgi:hypothetical protein